MKYFCYAYGCSTFLQRKKKICCCTIGKRIIGNGTESTEVLRVHLGPKSTQNSLIFRGGKMRTNFEFQHKIKCILHVNGITFVYWNLEVSAKLFSPPFYEHFLLLGVLELFCSTRLETEYAFKAYLPHKVYFKYYILHSWNTKSTTNTQKKGGKSEGQTFPSRLSVPIVHFLGFISYLCWCCVSSSYCLV